MTRRPAHARWPAAPALALTLAVLASSDAAAQDQIARRAMTVRFEDGVARVGAHASDLADAELVRALQRGLPQRLVTRVYAYRGAGGTPVAVGVRACRVTQHPWTRAYRVELQTATTDRTETLRTTEAVLEACLDLDALPIGRARDWSAARGERVWFAVVIELNPLSPDTVHRIRQWLAQPDGAGVGGDAFFGSFVSLFVNRRIGEADRVFRFRSAEEVRAP